MLSQIIFALLFLGSFGFGFVKFKQIYRNIMLGKPQEVTGDSGQRWYNMVLVAFGQKKMFARPIPAVLHLFIYVAFVITQIELIEIIADGLFGAHRLTAPYLGVLYTVIISSIEVLSLLALVATIAFMARRNLLKLPRFKMPELKGWPEMDANLILVFEVILVTCIFTMNGAERVMLLTPGVPEEFGLHEVGPFAISSWLGPLMFGGITDGDTLHLIERIGWWGHVLMVFLFLNYLPYSKHLHIMLAFPNTFFAKLTPKGEIDNMPEIQKEVASMMDPELAFAAPAEGEVMEIPKFGASDVFDLPWQNVLAAYSCTECGRCSSVCPANMTGKLLSPRKIMMDIRDRAHEIGVNLDANKTEFIKEDRKGTDIVLTKENYDDGKSLFDYITSEELRACTTCNACVDACPIMINPLDNIVALRRNLILEKSESPESWNNMFNNVENNGAPWAFPSDDRDKWVSEMTNA